MQMPVGEFEDTSVQTKTLSFNHTFTVEEKPKDEPEKFEYWINETAKLLFGMDDQGKPPKGTYMSVFRMTKKWSLDKIIMRYQLAVKHHGNITPSHKWFAERKKDLNRK